MSTYNTSWFGECVRPHGRYFQAGVPRVSADETNSTGSCMQNCGIGSLLRYARTHSVPPQAIVVIFTDASKEEWLFIAITILPRRAIIIPPYKCSGVQGCIQSPSDISSTNSASTVSSFRRKLKTYLFSKAFPPLT